MKAIALAAAALAAWTGAALAQEKPVTTAEIIAASAPSEWRPLDLSHTLVMTFGEGRTAVIELAPAFAPKTTANILALARAGYFDGLAIVRVQDNYVTQWGDPEEGDRARSLGAAAATLAPEWSRPRDRAIPFAPLPDRDGWALETGHSGGFPAARDRRDMWLTHCYGMVGVARGEAPDSGNGSGLYVVIGHSPRQLDRNITLAGRVVSGMEHLASLPRGTGALGFYERAEQRTPISSVRVAADLPDGGPAGRLELLRTDSASFAALTEARRNRRDAWYKRPAGHIDVCNVLLPARPRP